MTMSNLAQSVRFAGSIGVIGVFVPQDPGAPDELTQQGKVPWDWDLSWFKGHQIGTGQALQPRAVRSHPRR